MSESEKQTIVEAGVPTIVDEHQETSESAIQQTAGPSARPACSGEQAGLGRDDSHRKAAALETGNLKLETVTGDALETGNLKLETATGSTPETGTSKLETAKSGKPAELCHHAMESGLYCQSPALGDRRFCYSHLRLRGQRLRIARALAQRQSLRLVLPPLDDMDSVLAGLGQVGDALAAGLLPPRQADLLLYTLRQAAAALRWIARSRVGSRPPVSATVPPLEADRVGATPNGNPQATGEPGLSQVVGDRACPDPALRDEGVGINQKRLVEEYPGFEAEFGLPAGLDLSQPPHLLFPPSAKAWPSSTGSAAMAQAVVGNDPPPSKPPWTKESIELEQLEKRREHM